MTRAKEMRDLPLAIDVDSSNHCTHLIDLYDDFAPPPHLFAESLGVPNALSWSIHHQCPFCNRC